MKNSLLLIEDEPIERTALKLMIQNNCPTIQDIREAENGFEAIRLCRQKAPDIVIADINMPGMNGLETMREIKKLNHRVRFLILSSYNRFEYAQEALQLGAEEFILKPAKITIIREALEKIGERLASDQQKMAENSMLRDRMESVRPIVERDCIYALICQKEERELGQLVQLLEFKVGSGFCFVIRYQNTPRLIIDRVKRALNDVGLRCIGEQFHDLLVFFVLSPDLLAERKRMEVSHFVKMLLSEIGKPECLIGTGEIFAGLSDLGESYHQAIQSLELNKVEERIHLYQNVGEQRRDDISKIVRTAVEALYKGERRECAELFEMLRVEFVLKPSGSAAAKEQTYQFLLLLLEQIKQGQPGVSMALNVQFSLEYINRIQERRELEAYLLQQLNRIRDGIREFKQISNNPITDDAMRYIAEHYQDNITLEELAERLGISPFYLSKVIKKDTGRNFVDVLSEARIEAAKKLLAENKSIKEITFATGFNSQNYFAKIFKKHVGCSPREFRAALRNHKGAREN